MNNMKKIIYVPFILGIISCQSSLNKKEEIKKDYVGFSGKITNPQKGNIVISSFNKKFTKTISVTEDGTFKDTLSVPDSNANYKFIYGEKYSLLFLKNGAEISLTLNNKEFDKSLTFNGSNARENNYLAKESLNRSKVDLMSLTSIKNEDFDHDLKAEMDKMTALLNKYPDINQDLINSEKEAILSFKEMATSMHKQSVEKSKELAKLIGKPSPNFKNYTAPEGKLVSLSQFKGKYTYIDIWATWCGPCKAEIPSIKDFLATDDAKKMNILSISLDEEKTTETWKEMIMEKEMNWLQLKADSAWNSNFISAYAINSIPRFILLDPQGNVVNPDAPKPSSNEFNTMINELNL